MTMKPLSFIPRNRRAVTVIAVAAGCFVVLSLVSASVMSKQPVAADGSAVHAYSGVAGMAGRTIGAVALVLGLLYGATYAMKAISRRQGVGGVKGGAVSVLHRAHIAPKKSIYVIRVGTKAMVVGVTDVQISHLADLTEEDVAGMKAEEPAKPFKDHLLSLGFGRARK
jgi:flagellar biosynthetic protein FliO